MQKAVMKHIDGIAKKNRIKNLVKFNPAIWNFFPVFFIYKLLWFIYLCQALLDLYILTIM